MHLIPEPRLVRGFVFSKKARFKRAFCIMGPLRAGFCFFKEGPLHAGFCFLWGGVETLAFTVHCFPIRLVNMKFWMVNVTTGYPGGSILGDTRGHRPLLAWRVITDFPHYRDVSNERSILLSLFAWSRELLVGTPGFLKVRKVTLYNGRIA
jgi:hypothetical protein